MISIVFMTNVNYNIQAKNIIFTKNYVKQLIESTHKAIINELFNAAHSEVQTHQFISKTYKIVFNFKIVLKSAKDVAASRFIAVFDLKLIFQDFLNLIHQICFGILICCSLPNKTISVNIELAHLLLVSVLRVHFFQLSSTALFSHLFSSSSAVTFIDVTIFFIFTFAASWYSLFISSAFVILFIFAFKEIDFVMFRFRIHSKREIIEIMLIEIFDYQIVENKGLDMCRYENLNF